MPGHEDDKKICQHDVDCVPKDSGWAWMCCLGCLLQCLITSGGVIKCFGIMYVAFMEHLDSKAGNAGWIIVLCNCVQLLGSSFAHALSIKFTSRAVVFSGGLFLCGGYIASMFATKVEHLFVTYGLLLGIGISMSYYVGVTHMGQYFNRRRATANGIAFSGVGVGNLILPPVFRLLLDNYGLRGALLVMAGISLNVCVAGALLRPVSAYRVKKTNGTCKQCVQITKKDTHEEETYKKWKPLNFCKTMCSIYSLLEWSLLKKASFFLYGISMLCFVAGQPTYFITMPAYVEQVGHSKAQAAYILSIGGLGDLIGRFSTGFLVDCHIIPTYLLMASFAAVGTVTVLVTTFVTNFVPLCFVSFIFAVPTSAVATLIPVLLAEDLGAQRLPSAMGIVAIFMAVGMLIGVPIGGTLRDVTGTWNASFYCSSGMLFLTALTLLLRPVVIKAEMKRNNRRKNEVSINETWELT